MKIRKLAPCHHCKGKGELHWGCPTCNGSGTSKANQWVVDLSHLEPQEILSPEGLDERLTLLAQGAQKVAEGLRVVLGIKQFGKGNLGEAMRHAQGAIVELHNLRVKVSRGREAPPPSPAPKKKGIVLKKRGGGFFS